MVNVAKPSRQRTDLCQNSDKSSLQDQRAETGLVWSMLFAPQKFSELGGFVRPEMFARHEYQVICRGFREVEATGAQPNAVNIAHRLGKAGVLDQIGGEEFLAEIEPKEYGSDFTASYVERLVDCWQRREAIRKASEIIQAAESPGEDFLSLMGDMPGALSEFCQSATDPFPIYTANELDQLKISDDFLIEGLLKKGQPGGFGGPMKALKTTLMMHMGICLVTGRQFLGKFRVPKPVETMIFSGESGLGTLREIGRRDSAAAGWAFGRIEGLHISPAIPRLDIPEQMRIFERKIVERKAEVVFTDPYYLMVGSYGSDASNQMQMGNVLRELGAIGERNGITLILVHHTRKNLRDPYEPAELADFSQAGFAEFIRQYFMSNRREKWDSGNPGVHKMWFGWGGSAGQGGLVGLDFDETKDERGKRTWSLTVLTPEQAYAQRAEAEEERKESGRDLKRDARHGKRVEKVLKTLQSYPDGETERKIREEAGISGNIARDVFEDLLDDGRIVACEVTKGKRSYPGLKLSGTAGQSQWDKTQSQLGDVSGTGQHPFRGCPSPTPNPLGQHQFDLDDLPEIAGFTPSGEPVRGEDF